MQEQMSNNERKQIQSMLMQDALIILGNAWSSEETYYEMEAFKKSREDYYPYSYVEESETPVFFDEQTLEEWDWE